MKMPFVYIDTENEWGVNLGFVVWNVFDDSVTIGLSLLKIWQNWTEGLEYFKIILVN